MLRDLFAQNQKVSDLSIKTVMCKKCFFIDAASQRCVFYYTAVANMNKVNLPITEMFTVRHSQQA